MRKGRRVLRYVDPNPPFFPFVGVVALFICGVRADGWRLQLTGDAKAAADEAGVKGVEVSISHSDEQAVAVGIARF